MRPRAPLAIAGLVSFIRPLRSDICPWTRTARMAAAGRQWKFSSIERRSTRKTLQASGFDPTYSVFLSDFANAILAANKRVVATLTFRMNVHLFDLYDLPALFRASAVRVFDEGVNDIFPSFQVKWHYSRVPRKMRLSGVFSERLRHASNWILRLPWPRCS